MKLSEAKSEMVAHSQCAGTGDRQPPVYVGELRSYPKSQLLFTTLEANKTFGPHINDVNSTCMLYTHNKLHIIFSYEIEWQHQV